MPADARDPVVLALVQLLGYDVPARYHYLERLLPDGRLIAVWPLTFGRARLGMSAPHEASGWRDEW